MSAPREFTSLFLACGLGAGARGFLEARGRLGPDPARFRSLGGVDIDPASCRDFELLTGSPALQADLHTLTPAQLRAFAGPRRPDAIFSSAPCKGFSGLLSGAKALEQKYQVLNELVLKCIFLSVETWPESPPPLLTLENVPRIATRGAELLVKVRQLLNHYGYAIHEANLPMRGDTLAEGIAVKSPGKITTQIVRRLVDDIALVNEAELERAVATLISIEKTVVEGAGAAGLAAIMSDPSRFAGQKVGLVLSGGNIDTRLIASVLTRELAREGRLTQLSLDIPDRPGQLAAVATLLADAGANIIEVSHQRTFSDLPAKAALLQLVIETRDSAHLQEVMARLAASGLSARRS